MLVEPVAIPLYRGPGPSLDHTSDKFPVKYARQNQNDYETYVTEIREGRPEAMEIE